MPEISCPFCSLPTDRIISESDYTLTIRDEFPVSEGHTLIIPKRHVQSFFDLQAIGNLWATNCGVPDQFSWFWSPEITRPTFTIRTTVP